MEVMWVKQQHDFIVSPKMEAMWVKQQYDFIVVAKDGGHVS